MDQQKSDFDVLDVRNGLSAFSRLISPTHKKVFEKIFNTLQTGLSKLGDSASTQTKAISGLIKLINEIPMDGKQDYDVLGFIYEYLIQNFAANAGKKAGEFYTDVLYVDASNGFEKGAKKNILRASDIKRIVDVVKARSEVPGYSVLVKKEQIVANNYNLNIPRYLDTFEPAEPWDIHSIMFGGIPNAELDSLNEF